VDDELAKRNWPNADPIGRRIRLEAGRDLSLPLTVVGVVARVKLGSLSERGGFGQAYLPAKQLGGINASVVLKSRLTASAVAHAIREEVRAVDPAQPIHNLRTIRDVRDRSLTSEKLNVSVLGLFALVALTLSVVGLYGVIAYSVAQRQREIGVRTALGAQRGDILMLVLAQGMRLTVLGMALGVVAALWSTRWLSSLLFEITPADPATFIGVSMLLLTVAFIACWIPAFRAARIDPLRALRVQ
jgi:putative ABC transport system permease protein